MRFGLVENLPREGGTTGAAEDFMDAAEMPRSDSMRERNLLITDHNLRLRQSC